MPPPPRAPPVDRRGPQLSQNFSTRISSLAGGHRTSVQTLPSSLSPSWSPLSPHPPSPTPLSYGKRPPR